MAKLGGKADRTNVAGGMSGSPVYIDDRLVGAEIGLFESLIC